MSTAIELRHMAEKLAEGKLEDIWFLDVVETFEDISNEDAETIVDLIHKAGVTINE